MFQKPSNLFEAQIRDTFKAHEPDETDIMMKAFALLIYGDEKNRDVADLYKMLPLEVFMQIISVYGGRTVRFPDAEEMREALIVAVCYFYRNVKGYSWPQVKDILPFEISSISYGAKIKSLSRLATTTLNRIMHEYELTGATPFRKKGDPEPETKEADHG